MPVCHGILYERRPDSVPQPPRTPDHQLLTPFDHGILMPLLNASDNRVLYVSSGLLLGSVWVVLIVRAIDRLNHTLISLTELVLTAITST